MPITIELLQSPTPDARALVEGLEEELCALYPALNRHGLSIDRLFRPDILFFIARLNDEPAGCAGVAYDRGLAEVKRMYVRPTARRRGVARALLERIESEARARGHVKLFLETGDAQLGAMECYATAGFTRCGAFGTYAEMRPDQVARSVFFQKAIGAARGVTF